MAKKLNAAQRRYIENALLIAALGLTFKKLEEDYETKPLGEIAETTSGGTPLRNMSMYYGGNIPWIKSGELNDNLIESAEEYITEEGLANSSAKIYPKGTLVVALYGATVGKTGILGLDAASNQAVCAVSPKTNEITNEYIFWFLRHKRPEFLGMSFGGAQPNISQKIIRETQIPIPSLELQKSLSVFFSLVEKQQNGDINQKYPTLPDEFSDVLHTVMLIESLAARVNEAQRLREEAEKESDLLFGTALKRAYDQAVEIAGKTERLDDLCTTITDGTHVTPTYVDEGVPFLSVKDISSGVIDFSRTRFISPEEHAELTKRCKPERDDVLLTKVGTTGIAKVVDVDREFSIFVSVALLKLDKTRLDPKFTEYMLNSPVLKQYSSDGTRGVGNKNLVLKFIREFPIPVPPLDEQRRIVAYLDGLQAKVNALRGLQSASGEELSALLPSILDKAFRGEL